MKKILFLSLMLLITFGMTNAQTLVGSGQSYTTLKSAFDAINAGTLTGDIEFLSRLSHLQGTQYHLR